jgi:uncharacterized membrane protein YbaN (DUF454 family)
MALTEFGVLVMSEIKLEKNKFKRILYLVLGIISVCMGIIGIFLPVWPTTVFMILATWFFVRSSEKYYYMLIRNKIFGRMIRNYREFRGIEKSTRIKSISLLWITLAISFFLVEIIWIHILLLMVGIGVTWHLLALRTLTDEEIRILNDENYIAE